jgi:DNA processing protein
MKDHLALHECGINTQRQIEKLSKAGCSAHGAFKRSYEALRQIGLTEKQARAIKSFDFLRITPTLRWAEVSDQHIITYDNEHYPALLKEIARPPSLLYVKGELESLSMPQLAIVGSRKPSPVGLENAALFARELVESGFIVTSGMALGVDGAAHRGALGGGKTIAVLGAGMGHIYPRVHRGLAGEIAQKGALVSEFPLAMQPRPENFPRRNRIISGLSYGVLVVEAAVKSGSLITARCAMEQGREVFALPGSIHNQQSRGCHELIRRGAALVQTVGDICSELPGMLEWARAHERPPLLAPYQEKLDFLGEHEQDEVVLKALGFEINSVDTIISRTQWNAGLVLEALLRLELRHRVKTVPGGYIRIK